MAQRNDKQHGEGTPRKPHLDLPPLPLTSHTPIRVGPLLAYGGTTQPAVLMQPHWRPRVFERSLARRVHSPTVSGNLAPESAQHNNAPPPRAIPAISTAWKGTRQDLRPRLVESAPLPTSRGRHESRDGFSAHALWLLLRTKPPVRPKPRRRRFRSRHTAREKDG